MNTRFDLINHFIGERGFRSFLEIGTANGETFRAVNCERKVSVDPSESTGATFVMTSDEFFARNREKFDIVFVDGFHENEQAYRDVKNALRFRNRNGVIVMHDCHPFSEDCAEPHQPPFVPVRPWMGDVWKAFVRLQAELPYVTYVWDKDCGCGVIDTSKKAYRRQDLPADVGSLAYGDFAAHPEWMNFVKEPK